VTTSDPTRSRDRWQPLRELLAAIDAEIEDVYNARGLYGVRPRYVYPLIRLGHTGPLTIRELAESLGRTERGRSLVRFLEAEWRATEAAVAELDDEVMPNALSTAVVAVEQALRQRAMKERISDHLGDAMPPDETGKDGPAPPAGLEATS
jgi:hypothetical protein